MNYFEIYDWIKEYIDTGERKEKSKKFDKVEFFMMYINNCYVIQYDIANMILGDFIWEKEYNQEQLKEIFESIIKENIKHCKDALEYMETLI
jgi:hypothetical protein